MQDHQRMKKLASKNENKGPFLSQDKKPIAQGKCGKDVNEPLYCQHHGHMTTLHTGQN